MKRFLKWLVIALVGILAVIQFFGPSPSNPPYEADRALEARATVPPEIKDILEQSCFDCHSNRTRWPWYSYVAPTSWLVIGHVDHARSHMNFSTWPELTADDGRAEAKLYLEEICEMVQERTMPLSSYLFIHRSAHLSDTEIRALCGWTADEQLRVRLGMTPLTKEP